MAASTLGRLGFFRPFIGPPVFVLLGRLNCPVNKVSGIFACSVLMLFSGSVVDLHTLGTGISI